MKYLCSMRKRSPIDQLLKPVHRFIHLEFTGGIVLFISVIAAIVWANIPDSHSYHDIWETRLSIGLSNYVFDQPLHVWINDGLMALFFFVIGLELKREFMAGELSTAKKAMLPMAAALGGMLVPAMIYVLFNAGKVSAGGWGIPMATDIAFALGILSLAGKHIPSSVKVFLSALAVADDLGAVLVIALFYTSHIAMFPLIAGGSLLLLLWAGNLAGIRNVMFYLIVGLIIWYCFLISGVHATIAGVLVAFMIPARPKIDEDEYVSDIKKNIEAFQSAIPINGSLTTPEQHHIIENVRALSQDATTPLQKIEHALHPWVAFVVMPLFALANAGMHIGSDFFSTLSNPVSMGIAVGLIAGKFIGVFTFTLIMVKSRMAVLPQGATWKHICGVALLAGVGFTMSLFITSLAFDTELMIQQAKYGILLASFVAGITGIIVLRKSGSYPQ